jgi:hypothetical protein
MEERPPHTQKGFFEQKKCISAQIVFHKNILFLEVQEVRTITFPPFLTDFLEALYTGEEHKKKSHGDIHLARGN